MDFLGKSLNDLIKDDKKMKGKQPAKSGGIHQKMRNMQGANKKGAQKKTTASPKAVAKVQKRGGIRKLQGKTLQVNARAGRRLLKQVQGVGNKSKSEPQTQVTANRRQVLQLKRKLRKALQKRERIENSGKPQRRERQQQQTAQKPSAFRAQQSAGRKPAQQQIRQARRPAQAPVQARSGQVAKERRGQSLQSDGRRTPKGPIEKRKLKVRNIDRNTVTTSDLKTLFSKCGPLFNCNFDMDEFGQYLGTVTLVYQDERDAARAIRDYNRAAIDNKVITVEFTQDGGRPTHVPRFKQGPPKKHAQKTIKKQR